MVIEVIVLVAFIKSAESQYQAHDDDDELFLWYGWPTKGVLHYFQPGPLSEILTIVNLRYAASRTWIQA